jgi:uncharacterized damage-inducible protein DinB
VITPDWVKLMAAYNAEMNRRLYAAAGRLDEAARRQPRGAFWGSIHATLNHLLWADRLWMARFDGWAKPGASMAGSVALFDDFPQLASQRAATDDALRAWAERVDPAWLAGELTWFSGAAQRQVRREVAVLVTHMFNHQTHHRGQVHAMLTQAGERTGDTDLFLVVDG